MNKLFGIPGIALAGISGVTLVVVALVLSHFGRTNEVLVLGVWVVVNIAVFLPWFGFYQERIAHREVDYYANHPRRYDTHIRAQGRMANLWWDAVGTVRDLSYLGAASAVGALMSLACVIADASNEVARFTVLLLTPLALVFVIWTSVSYWRRNRNYDVGYEENYREAFAEAEKESLTPA